VAIINTVPDLNLKILTVAAILRPGRDFALNSAPLWDFAQRLEVSDA
jgi:hypothetical protein